MKKLLLIIFLLLAIFLGIDETHKYNLKKQKETTLQEVKSYLYKNNYRKDDIKAITPTYNSKDGYSANVEFRDEPSTRYQFFYSEESKQAYLLYVFKKKNGHWEQIEIRDGAHVF